MQAQPDEPVDWNNLELRVFNPTKLSPDIVAIAYGNRRSGKSVLFSEWLYRSRHDIKYLYVFSSTDEFSQDPTWRLRVPHIFTKSELCEDTLQTIKKRQEFLLTNPPPNLAALGWNRSSYTIRTVFDDVMHDEEQLRKKQMKDLLMNGRHKATGAYFCVQNPISLPKKLRTQAEVIILFAEKDTAVVERIWKENFRTVVPDWHVFKRIVDKYTANFNVLILDNTSKSQRLQDKLFVYKADINLVKSKEYNPYLDRYDDWHVSADVMWPFYYRYYRPPVQANFDYNTGCLPFSTPSASLADQHQQNALLSANNRKGVGGLAGGPSGQPRRNNATNNLAPVTPRFFIRRDDGTQGLAGEV